MFNFMIKFKVINANSQASLMVIRLSGYATPRFPSQGCHEPEQNKVPDFSLTVQQFSLTVQDDSDNESTKIRMVQIIFKTKLPCLFENI